MSKEEMVQAIAETVGKLFYEDIEFFWKMLNSYAKKKGVA